MALKGNLLTAQSGGPTAVINASVCGVVQEALRYREIEGIYGAINGILGVLNEEMIDLRKEDPREIDGLKRTPSSALGSCRYKLNEEDIKKVFEVIKAHNIRYFLYTGGNDSMDTTKKVADMAEKEGYEMRCIGIPKTVDNDLMETDHCPGYGSVARFNAIATRDAGRDTDAIYTSDTVKIVETMGRDTGWITASTALAKEEPMDAPHLIYLPERPFIEEKFLQDVQEVYEEHGRVLITVCEGLKDESGEFIVASGKSVDVDGFGHKQLGGVSQYLCDLIKERLRIKARFDKPGTIQRVSMVCVSKVDLEEAYMVGQMGMRYAIEGETGYMVGLERVKDEPYECRTKLVPLEKVAGKTKSVPDEYINKEGNFVTERFIEYVKPLIGEPLPEYVRLKGYRVQKKVNV